MVVKFRDNSPGCQCEQRLDEWRVRAVRIVTLFRWKVKRRATIISCVGKDALPLFVPFIVLDLQSR